MFNSLGSIYFRYFILGGARLKLVIFNPTDNSENKFSFYIFVEKFVERHREGIILFESPALNQGIFSPTKNPTHHTHHTYITK